VPRIVVKRSRARESADATAACVGIMPSMPKVMFTPQLRRFTTTPEVSSDATHLRAALDDAFRVNPTLRGYVLDDQGHVRPNVVIFIDGQRQDDRTGLQQALAATSTVYVLQALSGG
jgi:sulfur-carrier protein